MEAGGNCMKGFRLDDKGDVIIRNGDIELVSGNELLRQTVQQVTGTNKGEWALNKDEGIDFHKILGKNQDEDVIRAELETAARLVDDTLSITSFSVSQENRHRTINYTMVNENGEEIGGEQDYGV